jgi:hypothetical protein
VVAIGVAEHRFEIPHRDVDHDGQRLSVAQRRDTSGDVTGGPFGVGHRCHPAFLRIHRGGEGTHIELCADRDDGDYRRAGTGHGACL